MAQVCPNCGLNVRAGDHFCEACGAELEAPAPAQPDSGGPVASDCAGPDRSGLLWLGAGLAAVALAALALIYWPPGLGLLGEQPQPQLDEMLRTRLVGQVYEGGLDIEGWEDRGGGLIIAPIWFSQYERKDGAYLVLANVAQPLRPGAAQTTFRIADILLIPALAKGQEVSYFCRLAGQDTTRAIVAVIQPDYDNQVEWWRNVRRAWNISLRTGRIASIDAEGIECINEGWGL